MSGNVIANGPITCTPDKCGNIAGGIAEHVRLSHQEPGCIQIEISASQGDPCVFEVNERFADHASFDTHAAGTQASDWPEISQHLTRDIKVSTE